MNTVRKLILIYFSLEHCIINKGQTGGLARKLNKTPESFQICVMDNSGVSSLIFIRTHTHTYTHGLICHVPQSMSGDLCWFYARGLHEYRQQKSQDPSHAWLKLHQTPHPERLSKPESVRTPSVCVRCMSFVEVDQRVKSKHIPTGLCNPDKTFMPGFTCQTNHFKLSPTICHFLPMTALFLSLGIASLIKNS